MKYMWPFKKQEVSKTVKNEFDGVVRSDDEFHEKTLSFLIKLCTVLGRSYGPAGSSTLIEGSGEPIITKDGYTILENLRFDDAQEKSLHELIKRVSYNLVKTVGDGSTSAVISSSYMYENLAPLRNVTFRKHLLDILDRLVFYVEEVLNNELAQKVNPQNRKDILSIIASISNNNDDRIGDTIAGIFSKLNLNYISDIRIETDPKDSTETISHVIRNGFSYDKGPVHNLYFTMGGAKSAFTVINPYIYMSYEFFPDHYNNLKEIQKAFPNRPIVAIIEMTHEETISDCLSEFLKGNNKIYLIKSMENSNTNSHQLFMDMAIYLDADIIRDPKAFKIEQLGSSKEVEFYGNKTMFIGGHGMTTSSNFYYERIQQLEKEYDEIPINYPAEKGLIKVRLARLNGFSVKVLVGGITEEEKKARRFLVEDAILACKSTLSKGYGFGGNAGLFHAMQIVDGRMKKIASEDFLLKNFDKELVTSVSKALLNVFFNVYRTVSASSPSVIKHQEEWIETSLNSSNKVFNVITDEFETIDNTTVLAPIDTDIQILKASVSIVGMLLSINQFVS